MRGRILWASVLVVALLAACSKKDSLYIDTNKDGSAATAPAAQKSAQPAGMAADARPAAQPAPKP